jgi:hypothetical protein
MRMIKTKNTAEHIILQCETPPSWFSFLQAAWLAIFDKKFTLPYRTGATLSSSL